MKIAGAVILIYLVAIMYYYFSADKCDKRRALLCKNFHARNRGKNKDDQLSGTDDIPEEPEDKNSQRPETPPPLPLRHPLSSSEQQDHGGHQTPVLSLDTGRKWPAIDDFQKLHDDKGHKWSGNLHIKTEDKGDPETTAPLMLHSPISSHDQHHFARFEETPVLSPSPHQNDHHGGTVEQPPQQFLAFQVDDSMPFEDRTTETAIPKETSPVKALQLGIAVTVRSLGREPQRDLLMQDFPVVESTVFPQEGSQTTPRHYMGDFVFKTYSPLAFQHFREHFFRIKRLDFLTSLCKEPLVEISSGAGASGSAFYKTHDDQYILKTVHEKEAEFLQELLAGYYLRTWGTELRPIVMDNILPSTIRFHQLYDLKGSTRNRRAPAGASTLRDLDFLDDHPRGLYLKPHIYDELTRQIQRDILVLEKYDIMDYSLLLGIHKLDAPKKRATAAEQNLRIGGATATEIDGELNVRELFSEKSNVWESTMPRSFDEYRRHGFPARSAEGEHLLLFFGIIDILQTFTMLKQLEHAWKSTVYGGDIVTVHHPDFYASRFLNFTMNKVFKKEPLADGIAEVHNDVQATEILPEIILPKNPTSRTTAAMQLGIASAIKHLVSQPRKDLLMQDYPAIESAYFPTKGSKTTPPHSYRSFQFDTYASLAFHHLRGYYDITNEKFLLSLCTKAWMIVSDPTFSRSAVYLSGDDQFFIKNIQDKEAEFLQLKLLAGYYMNWNQNPGSLLPMFSGLYYYRRSWRKQMRLIVMNNLLPSAFEMHEKYDLKGSKLDRHASKKERKKKTPTLKDLDFLENHPQGIYLDASVYDAFERTLKRDCLVLETFDIMDYRLLLGIHYLDGPPQKEATGGVKVRSGGVESNSSSASVAESRIVEEPGRPEINVTHPSADVNVLVRARRGISNNDLDVDHWRSGILAHTAAGDRLLIFFGIVDILQTYDMFKQAEHAWKDVVYGGDNIDINRPDFYSSRFQNFIMTKVFMRLPSEHRAMPVAADGTPQMKTNYSDHSGFMLSGG